MGALGFYTLADYMPLIMYFLAALFVVAPVNVLDMPSRLFFGETLQRVLVPVQEVTWADFLMADIATSLSKSSADLCKVALALLAGRTAGRRPMLRRGRLGGGGTSFQSLEGVA